MRSAVVSNIHVSGGLFSEHFIRLMKEERSSFIYALPETFITPSNEDEKLPKQRVYDLKVAQVWADLKERWDTYGHKLTKLEPADARRVWTMPLLEALGFEPEALRKQVQVSDRLTFKFSHKGWGINPRYHNPPITHVVLPVQGLDSKTEKRGASPHDALQHYLNVHDDSWALLTNGLYLRILRDYHHTYVKGYVEFDLEAIFLTRSFRDFQALYRIAHASRFTPADTGNLYLEEYFRHSQLVGEKVGAKLRENVVKAVMALGNGFLDDQVLAELREDKERSHEFYEEILRVIYRIIFLLYAEQRGMLGGNSQAVHHDLYLEEYSMNALRERAQTDYRRGDRHKDHWNGLKSTFEILRHGSPEFGIYPYGGVLFDTDRDDYVSRYGCKNSELLEAVYYLTMTEIDGVIHRVSYADLDVVEVGAIYESLLENTPRITNAPESINNVEFPANSFILDPTALTRKTTGSYYTQQALIQELIKSALEPVITDRLLDVGDQRAQEEALLAIRVCDPACGSGAFLIAACNHLGERLARIRSKDSILTEDLIQQARRDVLQHCIYGVDLNPMAIELVKVSLWINALVKDRPLNFLDHHLKCGNSLLASSSELLLKGVPTAAFNEVRGCDEDLVKEVRNINDNQLKNMSLTHWAEKGELTSICYQDFVAVSEMMDVDPLTSKEKENKYRLLLESKIYSNEKLRADTWTSAFFWPLTNKDGELPTQTTLERINDGGATAVTNEFRVRVGSLAEESKFFHWYLEFPEIFCKERPGFDCVLGNPPWARLKLVHDVWFKGRADNIATCRKQNLRTKMIEDLRLLNRPLYDEWDRALRQSETLINFIANSGKFPLSGVGDINTYPVFTELASLEILAPDGIMGMVVKTGIATDFHTQALFSHFIEQNLLVSLYDFENRQGLFPIERNERFCLLTISGPDVQNESMELSFMNASIEMLYDDNRRYKLSKEELLRINPNTRNCPAFKTEKDKDITLSIYKRFPILFDESTRKNTWGIRCRRLFDMTNDSSLFAGNTFEEMIGRGFAFCHDGIFRKGEEEFLPLWEAKLFHQFDHRFGTFEGISRETRFKRKAGTMQVRTSTKQDAKYEITARYWMRAADFQQRIKFIGWDRGWMFSFRNVARANTDIRTSIATLSQILPAGHSCSVIAFQGDDLEVKALLFCAIFTSLTFDYVLRQTLGGTNISYYILKQLPVPVADQLERTNITHAGVNESLKEFLLERALYLTWTSHSLDSLGEAVSRGTGPHVWDEMSRRKTRAEIDAAIARLYGISREEYAYIIDSFDVLRQKDTDMFGEFRTRDEYLSTFDQISISSYQ